VLQKPRHHRAIRLAIFLQPQRVQEARGDLLLGKPEMTLEKFLSYTDDQLDAFVALDASERNLLLLPTPGFFLSFPSTGLCAVPVVDPGLPWGFSFAMAMPFDLGCYVALSETTSARPEICPQFATAPFVFSIGAPKAKQVILPPGYEEQDRQEIVAAMTNNRDRLVEVLGALGQKREIIAEAHRKLGLWPLS
jgi:hypothetical protein